MEHATPHKRPRKNTIIFIILLADAAGIFSVESAAAAQKRVYMAPDDHTDYFWSATADQYRTHFVTMLDYYLDQADATTGELPEFQSRFSADGSLWLREYKNSKTPGDVQRLVDRIKSGHISAPLNPLVITYGGVPAEAVLRSMYYAGQLERYHGLDFPLAIAMENAGMAYGLGALWTGSGAEYSWKGVCACSTFIPNLNDRAQEIYRWLGPDGSSILMKWYSLHNNDNQSIGGYAEARSPSGAFDFVTTNPGFIAAYPYNTIGVFGQGWDDIVTTNLNIQQTCITKSGSTAVCVVSDSVDFFKEFAPLYGSTIPTVSASFGNEWDLAPASLAEMSARVKRALEKLRGAEALATLVSLKNPAFLAGRDALREQAFLDLGLYFEHDFENGGPNVSGATRIAWQRQVANEIETYASTLMADATSALGAMIQKSGSNARFYVFNPLSWARTDIANISYPGALPAQVIDLSTGLEVPSQVATISGTQHILVEAQNIPSVGYKVFEIRPGSGQIFSGAPSANPATGVMENEFYRITVSPRGAITSFIDKQRGNREFAGTTGGFALNDLGPSGGTLQVENAGPVSATLVATAGSPLAHVTRITLTRGSDRVAIQNEVTQNFGGTPLWRFSVNVATPNVRHEEVGAVLDARLTTSGGHYSPTNARYDYLTLNHFADMSGAEQVGMTLSNADAYFMKVGNSSASSLDTATPQLSAVLGGSLRPSNPILNQAGDSYFLQRFALQSHGAFDAASAMRFSLEHQNPLAVGAVSGGTAYPETIHSYLSISDPNVLLWVLKPAEEGIGEGVIARVWNLASTPKNLSLSLNEPITSAKAITHIETDQGSAGVSAGALATSIAQNQILSFRLFPESLLPAVKIIPSDARAVESGDIGAFTVIRTGSTTSSLNVPYTVDGAATPGTDYQALSGVAIIPAGATSTAIVIVPISEAISEPDEIITVTLTPQADYLLGSWNSATASLLESGGTSTTTTIGGFYPFSEGTGGTTADVSGNNNTGILQNVPAWTIGKYGNGLNFDGVDDHISFTDTITLDLGNKGTIEAWVKLDTLNRWHSVIAKGNVNSNPAHNYALELNNSNRWQCIIGNGGSEISLLSSSAPATNQFYHVACVWNGTTLQLYINGVLNASKAQTLTPLGNTSPLYLGQFGGNADRLDGAIDEVRIYNQALTQTEIQSDMNTPISPPAPDTTSPVITGVNTTNVSTSSAAIAWTTNEPSDSQIEYGLTLAYGFTTSLNPALVTSHSQALMNLDCGTLYHYRVLSRDGAGNLATSTDNTFITATPDTVSPTVALTAPASGASVSGTISVAADASDNVGVLGVQFLLDGANLGAEDTSAPYLISWNTVGVPNGPHTLSAVARDAAGNLGTASGTSATVANDITPPSTPAALSAVAVSSSQIDLSWTASTDNIGVTGYRITRNGGAIATTTATTYDNTGLAANTTYTYTVAAFDAAGNFSTESTPASTTTPPLQPSTGLKASYALNQSNGITATDGSGNGNTGTLIHGPVWTTGGRYGNAINFDGLNDHVSASDTASLDLGNTGTIEAWAKLDTLNRWHSVIKIITPYITTRWKSRAGTDGYVFWEMTLPKSFSSRPSLLQQTKSTMLPAYGTARPFSST